MEGRECLDVVSGASKRWRSSDLVVKEGLLDEIILFCGGCFPSLFGLESDPSAVNDLGCWRGVCSFSPEAEFSRVGGGGCVDDEGLDRDGDRDWREEKVRMTVYSP